MTGLLDAAAEYDRRALAFDKEGEESKGMLGLTAMRTSVSANCFRQAADYARALSEKDSAVAATCAWSCSDIETSEWETACDQTFVLVDGNPTTNEMRYCTYCGRKIEQ